MRILDIFRSIAAIPHCSGDTAKLHEFIIDFAKKKGFSVETDGAGNILCYKNRRTICLQSHYDMVCVGRAPAIAIKEHGGYLFAEDSSLGADNGIGVAIMLALMEEGKEAEYLFTNDEEIGLVGAKRLDLKLQAAKMINLDSEEFGKIYVGCAGGVDLIAKRTVRYIPTKRANFYKITAKNFCGGHSGVDIDKDIPNAIKEFAHFVGDVQIGLIEAGERLNSIPVHLQAVVAASKPLRSNEHFEVEPAEPTRVIDYPLVQLLCAFANGVRGWERDFAIPKASANLATLSLQGKELRLGVSLRANSDEELERLQGEYGCLFGDWVYAWSDAYPPWQPKVTPLAQEVRQRYLRYSKEVEFAAIHAGLECAIFAQKYPAMEIVSLGPTIKNPHSTKERVKIDTIMPIYAMLKEML